jgi:exoribonuclease R
MSTCTWMASKTGIGVFAVCLCWRFLRHSVVPAHSALNGDMVAIELFPMEEWVSRPKLAEALGDTFDLLAAERDAEHTPMATMIASPGVGSTQCMSHNYRKRIAEIMDAVREESRQPAGRVVAILEYVHNRRAVGRLDVNVRAVVLLLAPC